MKRFENVLILANEGTITDGVMARALWLAQQNSARITLIDVIETASSDFSRMLSLLPGGKAREVEEDIIEIRRDRLKALAEPFAVQGVDVETLLLNGVGFVETIRQVLRAGHDLVLKGADQSMGNALLRGGDMHLLRKCPCPVWILNSDAEPASRRIVAAVDPDPQDPVRNALNNKVMQLATSLASNDDARVDVLNAWHLQEEMALRRSRVHMPEDEIQAILAKTEAASAARLKVLTDNYTEFSDRMRILHVKGVAEDVIIDHAEVENADTLVMGTISRTGLAGYFIGNTAETVLSRVNCSVLTVKPEQFVSPVTLDDDKSEPE